MGEDAMIHMAMAAILADIPAIPKGRENQGQHYKFRGIDDVYLAVHDVLAKHAVFCMPEVQGVPLREERTSAKGSVLIYTMLTVKHTFYAVDGSSVSCVTVGEAMDSGDKSCNKAMSAAMKYAFIETFAIPCEGDHDTENQNPEPKPRPAPRAAPRAAARPAPAAAPAPTPTAAAKPAPAPAKPARGMGASGIYVVEAGENHVTFDGCVCITKSRDGSGIKLGNEGDSKDDLPWLNYSRKDGKPTGLSCNLEWKQTGEASLPKWMLEGQYAREPFASIWSEYQSAADAAAGPDDHGDAYEGHGEPPAQEPQHVEGLSDEDIPF